MIEDGSGHLRIRDKRGAHLVVVLPAFEEQDPIGFKNGTYILGEQIHPDDAIPFHTILLAARFNNCIHSGLVVTNLQKKKALTKTISQACNLAGETLSTDSSI